MSSGPIQEKNGPVEPVRVTELRPSAAPAAAPAVVKQAPLGTPLDNPEWATPEDRQATFVGVLEPEDAKRFWELSEKDRRDVCYYYALMCNSQSATVRGAAVTSLEMMMGREMRQYGQASTDSFATSKDLLEPVNKDTRVTLEDHQRVAARSRRGLGMGWDAVEPIP